MSDSDDYDSEDFNEAFEKSKAEIKEGTLKVVNADGTFRCPFSPNRKKQTYKYHEILQHAVGVGKGTRTRGAIKAGNHQALAEYLKTDKKDMAQPQAERVLHLQQDIPRRHDNEEKKVCPWMGILENIEIQARRAEDGFKIGAGAADIKEKLKV